MKKQLKQIQMMSVLDIKPHTGNAAIYSTVDVSELQKSMDLLQEMLEPIIITESGSILSGHRRFKAACHLEWKSVPVRIVDVPEKQELIYIIAANSYRDKTWMEKAAEITAIGTYADTYGKDALLAFLGKDDSKLTIRQQIAEVSGICEVYVSRLQKILDTNPAYLAMVDAEELTFNQAYNACVKGKTVVPEPKSKTKLDGEKFFCPECPKNKKNVTKK